MTEAKIFPEIVTDRLVMKQLTTDHIEPVFRHYAMDEINKFTDSSNAESTEDAAEIIQWGTQIFENGFGILWGLFDKQTDEFMGEVNYVLRRDNNMFVHRAEIGYDRGVKHWGKGYITEAACSAIAHIFNLENINRIEALIHPGNLKSQKVVERQGFTRETVLREYLVKNGAYWDMVMYSLLKREWQV